MSLMGGSLQLPELFSVTNTLMGTTIPTGQMGGVCSAGDGQRYYFFLCFFSAAVFLSFFGIASIGLSCLVALFLYHVVFGIQYLGILNGVAAFVIVGIGKLIFTQSLCFTLPCLLSAGEKKVMVANAD